MKTALGRHVDRLAPSRTDPEAETVRREYRAVRAVIRAARPALRLVHIAMPGSGEALALAFHRLDSLYVQEKAMTRSEQIEKELLSALRETLAAMRALRALAFTGSRIPVDRYPEKAQADAADAAARAAIAKAEGRKP